MLSVKGRETGMALYTFYPCKPDGTSETFTCFDLRDDGEACLRAQQVLDDHRGSSGVVVFAGDRRVTSRHRIAPDLPPVPSGSTPF